MFALLSRFELCNVCFFDPRSELYIFVVLPLGLANAMNKRQVKVLEDAINYVKRNGFEVPLAKELIEANKVMLQLRRLERIRAEILELKQSTVAEIRSYQKPPPIVHQVMTATFLVLGHKEKETKVSTMYSH